MSSDKAFIVIDVDRERSIPDGIRNAANNLAQKAEDKGHHFFFIVEEGSELAEDVDNPTVYDVLTYENESNWYEESRLDGQLTNRDVTQTIFTGPSKKKDNLPPKEKNRGRQPDKRPQ